MSEHPDDREEGDLGPDDDGSLSDRNDDEPGSDDGSLDDRDDGTEATGPEEGTDPFPSEEEEEPMRTIGGESADDEPGEVPLGAVADRLGGRDLAEGDDLFEEAFEDVAADGIDGEALWADLRTELPSGLSEPESAEGDVYEVPEREYCRRCQFFSAPPDVACTYEGSEILTVVDTEHFRVEGCPIVRGEETLGDANR